MQLSVVNLKDLINDVSHNVTTMFIFVAVAADDDV
jgi:hypothetical protein